MLFKKYFQFLKQEYIIFDYSSFYEKLTFCKKKIFGIFGRPISNRSNIYLRNGTKSKSLSQISRLFALTLKTSISFRRGS